MGTGRNDPCPCGSGLKYKKCLEAGIVALSVFHQEVPPTVNLDSPDPDCDLDYVPHTKRQVTIEYALSNSFGFGGTNAALVLRRYEA
jgi:3-oxoacyl-[acyl-carrier-protein] synthase II